MNAELAIWLAVGSFAFTIFNRIFDGGLGISKKFAQMQKDFTQEIAEMRNEFSNLVAAIRLEATTRGDNVTKYTGESLAALREQMHQMEHARAAERLELEKRITSFEKWTRDTFVKEPVFQSSLGKIESILDKFEKVLDTFRDQINSNRAH